MILQEKLTRSALKSEFDKHVIGDTKTLVILDSLNYIKGFRYELHCISKASGEKHGVIWLLCKEEVAKKWNEKRNEGNTYSNALMNELILRYEPPDSRNRWDKPLYRVDVHSTLEDSLLQELHISNDENGLTSIDDDEETGKAAASILKKSVYNMHSLSDAIKDSAQSATDSNKKIGSSFRRAAQGNSFRRASKQNEIINKNDIDKSQTTSLVSRENTVPKNKKRQVKIMEDLVNAILDSFLLNVERLTEGQSTKIASAASSNVLNDVDSFSNEIATAFLHAQSLQNGGTINVPVGSGKVINVSVNKTVQIAEMKRLRRQYVRWVKDNPPKDASSLGIAASFLSFLQNQL